MLVLHRLLLLKRYDYFITYSFFIEPVQELIKKGPSLNGLTFLYFIRERNRFSSMKLVLKLSPLWKNAILKLWKKSVK